MDRSDLQQSTFSPPQQMVGDMCGDVLAGKFVVAWLAEMEKQGLRAVYLRNYETLPADIGNDVDLLIETGKTKTWINEAKKATPKFGWRFLRAVPFGCTSLFFFRPNANEVMHIDLNERIEWHCIPFANESGILSRRRWNGKVFIPALEDELFLNVATRLVFQGKVREKHRAQWAQLRTCCSNETLTSAFSGLGPKNITAQIVDSANSGDWTTIEALHVRIRGWILAKAMLKPLQTVMGILRFAGRTVRRLAYPPGYRFLFVVSESDKSCISNILPKCVVALANWGNLSQCRVESPRKLSARIRQHLFRARNGVVIGVASLRSCRKPDKHRNTIWIPVDGIVDPAVTPTALIHRIVDAVRFSIDALAEGGDATE